MLKSTLVIGLFLAVPAHAQSGAEMVAQMNRAKAAYRTCALSETLNLGAKSQESADTILRAVRYKCDAQWKSFSDSIPDGGGVAVAVDAKRKMTEHVRTTTENEAIAVLLEARAKSAR